MRLKEAGFFREPAEDGTPYVQPHRQVPPLPSLPPFPGSSRPHRQLPYRSPGCPVGKADKLVPGADPQ